MTLSQDALRDLARAHMDTDPTHDLAHLDRVWANVQAIASGEGTGDRDVLMASTYLHDLVNLPKSHPDRAKASRRSAVKAATLLAGQGYSDAQLDGIAHAIEAHSFSAAIPLQTPEAGILRDADRLDSLGAIGIARTFTVSGALNRDLYAPKDPFAAARELEDHRFALDHWKTKLLQLGGGLTTPTARTMARQRLDFMVGFLDQLALEIDAPLPQTWRPN